jgi:hypothetical protein
MEEDKLKKLVSIHKPVEVADMIAQLAKLATGNNKKAMYLATKLNSLVFNKDINKSTCDSRQYYIITGETTKK